MQSGVSDYSTFFWGGETFAPKLKVKTPQGAKNIQSFLQDAFLGAVEKLVDAVGDLDTVLGVEVRFVVPLPSSLRAASQRAAPRLHWLVIHPRLGEHFMSRSSLGLTAELQHRPAPRRLPFPAPIVLPWCRTRN